VQQYSGGSSLCKSVVDALYLLYVVPERPAVVHRLLKVTFLAGVRKYPSLVHSSIHSFVGLVVRPSIRSFILS